ncbi:hypothetical protein GLOTRDRAFT_138631 [Gloeophyllum trabeum ATCC 11539]|uniref:Uncharacterized protein n=1 Tax=Gloeophyllum trabeum (strain ATCC 11539 / FP-39264 / Madison 617) TaxID=670483 RepID=S7Q791_GLOTA|nr:uncharacterized protein GLOTRDRAFT_138631 [Gloeophyllum trabeum ATCC 11539]EPQ55881.1 hypothetical protein GLOTRDRAFT_138631 [Gloeophyllum trabeum ATCC 11539]
MSPSLDTIPQEVVEHVAYFAATQQPLGPPSGIVPLLLASRRVHGFLSFESNPHLYARIFQFKFDSGGAAARDADVSAMAHELRRRSHYMKRIRARAGCTVDPIVRYSKQELDLTLEILWMAFLMTVENEGRNEEQLRGYAGIDGWLRLFWFDDAGASFSAAKRERWPQNNECTALAMWLFWFFLRPEDYVNDGALHEKATDLVKLIALGAHQYHLCGPYHAAFERDPTAHLGMLVTHYARPYRLLPPPITVPAVLCYLSLMNYRLASAAPAPQLLFARRRPGRRGEWRAVWYRCLGPAADGRGVFDAGSLDGIWEGIFTYTEFTAYAALLSGAPPRVLLNSLVAQHRHTWRLREYRCARAGRRVGAGEPLRGFLPPGVRVEERQAEGVLEVWEAGRAEPAVYTRLGAGEVGERQEEVGDVLVVGEGHSSWGQFNLLGRVRPWDGFVSLSKEYVDGDRGKWLYRGYLVGNAEGHIAGRWRDTLSPPSVPGYEGCFAMSRRR